MSNPAMDALARAKQADQDKRETAAASIVNARLSLAPHIGNRDEWPTFAEWAKEKGLVARPARPATVSFFLLDSVALGIERLLAVVESISAVHAGLADPTLSPCVSAALATIAPIAPPRHWPKSEKHQFLALPRSLQQFVADHEKQQDKAFRTSLNKALAKLKLENSNGTPETPAGTAAVVAH